MLLLAAGCDGVRTSSPLVGGKDAGAADVVCDDVCGTTYEIFVGSFADGDGDGIGDLNGIAAKLDYLNDGDAVTREDLGVNALWLTPVFPSPTYHKYDAADYLSIDPDFGTLEDFDALLAACHARGVRLYLDLAINHTSTMHPWFAQAADYLRGLPAGAEPSAAECVFLDYYHFSREQMDGYAPLYMADGRTPAGWFYEARFWSGMPDLNLDSGAVRAEIAEIARFWLARGVDGFRLDAVTSYYTDDHERSAQFLLWFNDTVKAMKPDAYLVGEAWENQDAYARLYASGVDSFFDFAFAGQEGVIAQTVRSGKSGQKFAVRMREEEALYASYRAGCINAPFYTNHDMARSAGYYAQDGENRAKLAFALNLLQTGNAFVYYGEELGMKGSGKDENKRAPFAWADGDGTGGGTSARHAGDAAFVCAAPADMDDFDAAPFGSLAEQKEDEASMWNYCREAIHLRARHPLIARGRTVVPAEGTQMAEVLADHPSVCFFLRESGEAETAGAGDAGADDGTQAADGDALWICVNTGAEPQTIALDQGAGDVWTLSDSLTVGEERVKLTAKDRRVKLFALMGSGDTLYLPGYAIAVLE